MNAPVVLGKTGRCPQCGADLTFPFASAAAQVCKYCRFVIVRMDRNWQSVGKLADLVAIASPVFVGAMGAIAPLAERQHGRGRVRIAGRVQYDRVRAASAPWQEFFVHCQDNSWRWLAQAQGRWYLTSVVPARNLPTFEQAMPGIMVQVPGWPAFVVTERGSRKLLSAEGELPFPIRPDEIERYADLSGPGNTFATIDYGDGSSAPVVFAGHQLDPGWIYMDSPPPPDAAGPAVPTKALVCPGCAGALPLTVPAEAERVVCAYCGMQSDVTQGALQAIRRLDKPPVEPRIPLGATGTLCEETVICIGFLVRGTTVEGERYRWREYLLYSKTKSRYVWLAEEDGEWQHIVSISPGDVMSPRGMAGSMSSDNPHVVFANVRYERTQSVRAEVEHVLGEFYWKIEAGETVQATEYRAATGDKLSQEQSADEVVWSFARDISWRELQKAFPDSMTRAPGAAPSPHGHRRPWVLTWLVLIAVWLLVTVASLLTHTNRVVYDGAVPLEMPAVPKMGAGATAAKTSTIPTPPPGTGEPFFTPPFTLEKDSRSLLVELTTDLSNSWAGFDIALVEESTGQVREATADIEYYFGRSDGEDWSEGSRKGSLWFSRVDAGTYILRVDGAWDPLRAAPVVDMQVTHDTWSSLYVFGSFGLLLFILIGGSLWARFKAR